MASDLKVDNLKKADGTALITAGAIQPAMSGFGLVPLVTGTITSSIGVDYTCANFASSTYSVYLVVIDNLKLEWAGDGYEVKIVFTSDATTAQTASSYNWALNGYDQSGTERRYSSAASNNTYAKLSEAVGAGPSESLNRESLSAVLWCYGMQDSASYSNIMGHVMLAPTGGADQSHLYNFSLNILDITNWTGVAIHTGDYNFDTDAGKKLEGGRITAYGLKTS